MHLLNLKQVGSAFDNSVIELIKMTDCGAFWSRYVAQGMPVEAIYGLDPKPHKKRNS
jgi:hypothetical protein